MKQFLLDKLNNFTQETIVEFGYSITNNLPSSLSIINNTSGITTVWGELENGFWYLDNDSAWFFENNGIVHSIDTKKDRNFYDLIREINEDVENNVGISTYMEFEELTLENNSHPSLSNGQKLYYNKFVTPTESYGNTLLLDMMLGKIPRNDPRINEQYYKLAQDSIPLIKKYPGISILDNPVLLRNDQGYFFLDVTPEDKEITIEEFCQQLVNKTESKLGSTFLDQSAIEYLRHLWNKSIT